jgi:precorrin-6A/cobalt-precorrin-6A reductase
MPTAMQNLPSSISKHSRRILILGGTSEASQLAARLTNTTGLTVISSLAGRVSQPGMPAGIVRIGGFGGPDGLSSYLAKERIDLVIDATHPFASRISRNAELACNATQVPLIAFERPPWKPHDNDRWISAPNVQSAALLINDKHKRIFLSIGRQELGAFSDCNDAWFLIRSIDEPTVRLPANSKLILQRGPFDLNGERKLLRDQSINIIVSKNSGGTATYAKIEAARQLAIPIVMIDRPPKHNTPTLDQVDDLLGRLSDLI